MNTTPKQKQRIKTTEPRHLLFARSVPQTKRAERKKPLKLKGEKIVLRVLPSNRKTQDKTMDIHNME